MKFTVLLSYFLANLSLLTMALVIPHVSRGGAMVARDFGRTGFAAFASEPVSARSPSAPSDEGDTHRMGRRSTPQNQPQLGVRDLGARDPFSFGNLFKRIMDSVPAKLVLMVGSYFWPTNRPQVAHFITNQSEHGLKVRDTDDSHAVPATRHLEARDPFKFWNPLSIITGIKDLAKGEVKQLSNIGNLFGASRRKFGFYPQYISPLANGEVRQIGNLANTLLPIPIRK